MAKLVLNATGTVRGDPSGSHIAPAERSPGEDGNSQARHEWNWKKELAKPLPPYPPIVPRSGSDPVELSFGQQRLWFLSQLESGSAAYNVPMAWRIVGAVDSSALQRSLDRLILRHEVLRTTFPAAGGYPRQVINSAQPAPLTCVDLRSVESSARESELERRIRTQTQTPFDLAAGPVMRAALFRLSDDEHIFVLVLHHIVCDGPSIGILLDEVALFYAGFTQGVEVVIPELPVQYADFSLWQREALAPELRETQLTYWREQLRACPASLDFPSDHMRSAISGFLGGMECREIDQQLSEEFRSFARQTGVTRFMALLALFQVLLARYTGQRDISVGCPMTHRTRPEVFRVVGFFANMMVLRLRLEGNPTFRRLLQTTREVALGAYAHQDLPFEQLVAELQPERVVGRNPYFQVMLVVEESAWRDLRLKGTQCTPFPVHNGTAKFDFSLYVIDHPEGFRLGLEYNTPLFDAETVRRLLAHFENLLRSVVANPDGRVLELPLLSAAERQQVLLSWNNADEEYSLEHSASHLIEMQADKFPDAVAVCFQNQKLTYRELNSRANRLARHLVSLGAGTEVVVAICVERSLDLVVSMLAVMKSGAAYLPLDPSHPSERRDAILHHSGAQFWLTNKPGPPHPTAADGFTVLLVEEANYQGQSDANLDIEVRPGDLAYVIYTSGSTGRPKGVQVEHRSLTNFLCSMSRRPGMSASDVLLAVTTVAFDIAGLELWLPLTTGASVILASRDEVTDPYLLVEMLERFEVTVMQATPATWQMLLASGWKGNPRLKALCGGEALTRAVADKLLDRCSSVWNLYGPTETTIWSSTHEVRVGEGFVVPIGRPIGNTIMHVLDRYMQRVPIGVRGELYIGGAGVARGYLGAPELTAERFVENPFEAGSRLYRTGDLVRQRRDGLLEFLGRLDRQTKIRGYRIEPAEIESVLQQSPALQQAAVIVRDHLGETELVAYVVPANPGDKIEQAELTRLLEKRLPSYMLPSAFVVLDTLPTTPNGKLDWKAFPAPDRGAGGVKFTLPRDEIEHRLTSIWEEVLDLHPVGVTDNFFDLGGHSVLATRLFARVEKKFGRRLPLGTLFEAPTIEKLAAILRQHSPALRGLIQVQAGKSTVLPIFFVQARVGYHALALELGPDQPVYVVPYDDLLANDPERGLSDLAAELVAKIRERQPCGPYYLGGWCLAGRVAYAIAHEFFRQGEEVALLAIIDIAAPGYTRLSSPPALRSLLGRLRWHLHYALHANRQEKTDWIAGGFHALGWQARFRAWQLARMFFRRMGRPLPPALRHINRLTAEAADKEVAASYPGRITLFRASEKGGNLGDQSDLGWSRIAALGVEVCEIAGLKRTLLRANAAEVGRRLKKCLAFTKETPFN